ncbi:MAG TPA: endonuclease [Paludibacteraceae bacterium]|nr:endonuclease [Paludibacteraceae bacterium]
MKKLSFLLPLFFILSVSVFAQIPAGYYSAAVGKTGAALKTQLSSIITAGAVDKGYDFLYTIYKTSDNLPNGKVWDMYSLKSDGTANYYYDHGGDKCGSYSNEGSCYNREHTFCDSWLGNASPQRSDAHHLIPTDGYVNNRRSSFPHGKVGSASWTSSNGSKLGSSDASTGYSGTVFEPIDEFKGDFARMYFYVATRYESKIGGWANNGSAGEILAGNSYPAYKAWFYNLMLKWNAQDPVSQKEIDRNNAIYTNFQHNRNPFIDHPEFAEYIWGTKKGQAWSESGSTSPTLFSPTSGSTVDFGTVIYQQTTTKTIVVSGMNLTGDLTLSISGADASYFSVPVTTIPKASAQAGYSLTISYNAPVVGTHNAILILSGGGITDATVNLTATATATNCQNLNFSAPFSSTMSPFTQYSVTGSQSWYWKSSAYGVAMSGYVNSTSNANEDWLISPSLDLSTSKDVVLAFDHTINKGVVTNMPTENTVWISNNYSSGNPNTAIWTQLTIPTYPAGNDWTFVNSGTISIPTDKCQLNTFIGFKYISTTAANSTWEIKNLTVNGTCISSAVYNANKSYKHKVFSTNKNISISNLENEDLVVYDICGKNVFSSRNLTGETSINSLNSGIYIIKAGNEILKAMVK